MWQILGWGAIAAASLIPYVYPPPVAQPKPTTSDRLLQISLVLGIAISAFTLWQYLKRGRL